MIIQTGQRTDIPAFYSGWFANRLKEGYVLVRNPFNPLSVTKYILDPDVVDLIVFCTKNPEPIFEYMKLLEPYNQLWFVTITPYGKDIEPNVPDNNNVMESFIKLSKAVGKKNTIWRYDPILINEDWSINRHIEEFNRMAKVLGGYTETCVISFIDLYKKVRINYPEIKEVNIEDQLIITEQFVKTGRENGITIKPCAESDKLKTTGADCSGCMTLEVMERAIDKKIHAPINPKNRKECACYITGDIGQYDTCAHLCRYCYANTNEKLVRKNISNHDPNSPLLIGNINPDDKIHQAKQKSWIEKQMRIEEWM